MEKKVCNKCKEEKPLDDFYDSKRNKDGKRNDCIVCCREYKKLYHKERYIKKPKNPKDYKDSRRKYKENNREKIKEMNKKYYENNIGMIREKYKIHYDTNREKILIQGKIWRTNNPDRIKEIAKRNRENMNRKFEILKNSSELITKICSTCNIEKTITNFYTQSIRCKECTKIYQQNYYSNNSERVKNRNNDYRKSNPEKTTERKRITKQRRKKKDPIYRAMSIMSGRLRSYVKLNSLVKRNNFAKIIGITPEGFREYIESQFEEGMTWDNRGIYTWHLDHIIPISTAKTIEDVERLTHYTNFQPLWSEVNRSKGDKILPEFEHLVEERLGDIRVPPNPNSLRSV
jgi:hypothetical protein